MTEVNKALPHILKMRLLSEKTHREQIESNPTSGALASDSEDTPMEEPEPPVKQESTTPTVMTPSESAVVVPDLTSDSPMEIAETEQNDEKEISEMDNNIKKEPITSIPGFANARSTVPEDSNHPSPHSRAATPESNHPSHNDRHQTPEPRTPGSTPGSTPGAQTNSAETSPSRKAKRTLPPPERMVTRGVSGAIRHRSVDEILGTASERSPRATSPVGTSGAVIATPTPMPVAVEPMTPAIAALTASAIYSAPSNSSISHVAVKPPPLKLHAAKKHAQPTTTPTLMKRTDSRFGSQRYDALDGSSSGRPTRHVDLYAWQLKVQSQPIYKAFQTATKVVNTKDWKVAREELKLMRAMQRIDTLKEGNRWSFKQIKKHRGPARTKTHWDHLLDEVRWTQVDYKEERRWKIATAYQVSRWIMAWHEADDKSLVCVQVCFILLLLFFPV
ncbi:hypothetical protein K457DRAFT_381845 [Linnemannia elongata AG-77]|uniref:HSA domain-containing protein n=1 Tax=Linnemannia elongata AG-77 TaxID=1314771 RepID=A0A197KGJ0_9FUNG|nr:hypothetical protein K457DRAFT_381845 [Linnemannia elongata AG-77]